MDDNYSSFNIERNVSSALLKPLIGGRPALIISGIVLCALIFAVAYIFLPKLGKANAETYSSMGILWFGLTFVVEFGFGLASGQPIEQIVAAYNIRTGNIWAIIFIYIGFVPYTVAAIRKLILEDDNKSLPKS